MTEMDIDPSLGGAAPGDPGSGTIRCIEEFTLDVAADRAKTYDTLLHRGRRVTEVEARIVEAQFRLSDGSTVVLLNDDTPYREMLTLVLVGPDVKVRDRLRLGGAFTPGYLTYAYPVGENEIAFCWHELDQVLTIGRYKRWFGLRSGWLRARELAIQPPRPAGAELPKLGRFVPTIRLPTLARVPRRRGRAMPALVWLAWLSMRIFKFERGSRTPAVHGREPRR